MYLKTLFIEIPPHMSDENKKTMVLPWLNTIKEIKYIFIVNIKEPWD